MPVKGLGRVKAGFRAFEADVSKRRTEAAVYAVLDQGAAVADTMTPIDTSNLVNSRYSPQVSVSGTRVVGHVGYTAAYAGAVHEAPGTLKGQPRPGGDRGDFWDPGGEPQFLARGFEEVEPYIPAILKAAYES